MVMGRGGQVLGREKVGWGSELGVGDKSMWGGGRAGREEGRGGGTTTRGKAGLYHVGVHSLRVPAQGYV
jgi:hypothetical protein